MKGFHYFLPHYLPPVGWTNGGGRGSSRRRKIQQRDLQLKLPRFSNNLRTNGNLQTEAEFSSCQPAVKASRPAEIS